MAFGGSSPVPSTNPAIIQLEGALAKIGVTTAHKQIIALILIGALFDSFEQNTIGIVGPALRQQWGLTSADIGLLNTVTFAMAALGRLSSGYIGDRYGRRVMLGINLLLFTARFDRLRTGAEFRRALPVPCDRRFRCWRRNLHRGYDAVRVLLAEVSRNGGGPGQCRRRGPWKFSGAGLWAVDLLNLPGREFMALAVRSTRRSLPAGGVLSPLRSGDATLSGVARQGGGGQSRSLHPGIGIAQSEGREDHHLSATRCRMRRRTRRWRAGASSSRHI